MKDCCNITLYVLTFFSKLDENTANWIVVWHIATSWVVTYVSEHTLTYCRISDCRELTAAYRSILEHTAPYRYILEHNAAYCRISVHVAHGRIRKHLSECWSKLECYCTFGRTVIYVSILPYVLLITIARFLIQFISVIILSMYV